MADRKDHIGGRTGVSRLEAQLLCAAGFPVEVGSGVLDGSWPHYALDGDFMLMRILVMHLGYDAAADWGDKDRVSRFVGYLKQLVPSQKEVLAAYTLGGWNAACDLVNELLGQMPHDRFPLTSPSPGSGGER